MAINLLGRLENKTSLEAALLGRLEDYGTSDQQSEKTKGLLLKKLLNKNNYLLSPPMGANTVVSSLAWNEFLRDSKFFVRLNNLEMNDLEASVETLGKRFRNYVNKLSAEIISLDGKVLEEEARFYNGWEKVIHCNFSRQVHQRGSDQRQWASDPKTDLAFGPLNVAGVIPAIGMTLPVSDNITVPIADCYLIGEETDFGDVPLIASTDPRYTFLPNKVFKHVVAKIAGNRNRPRCTFMYEFPSLQLINVLVINSASAGLLTLDAVSYVNERNEVVTINAEAFTAEQKITLLFEPVRTKYFKLSFLSANSIYQGTLNFNSEAKVVYDLLSATGFTNLPAYEDTSLEGEVFDFSIRSIEFNFATYAEIGYYKSKAFRVKNAKAVYLKQATERLYPYQSLSQSGTSFFLPTANTNFEYYLGIELNAKGRTLVDLLPLRDQRVAQTEYLSLLGNTSRIKFFPDLLWNVVKNRILEVQAPQSLPANFYGRGEPIPVFTGPTVTVVTEAPHGLVVGQTASIYGRNHPLPGVYEVVSVLGDYSFTVVYAGSDVNYTADESTTPYLYLLENYETTQPLVVYEDGVELKIGADYQLNYNDSPDWLSTYFDMDNVSNLLADARSNTVSVKILNVKQSAIYWVSYYPLVKQALGKSNLVRLGQTGIIFDKRINVNNVKMQLLAVVRADSKSPFVTPLLKNYTIGVSTDVS